MALSSSLISQLVKTTNDSSSASSASTTVYGTVKYVNNSWYVQPDGSEQLVPVAYTVSLSIGDRVTVSIGDHTAIVTGNLTDQSASSAALENVQTVVTDLGLTVAAANSYLTLLKSTLYISGSDVEVEDAVISIEDGTVTIQGVSITALDSAISVYNSSFEITDGIVTGLKGVDGLTYLTTAELTADHETVANLDATYATITNLNAAVADIESAYIKSATVESLLANYATIENLNATNGYISTLQSDVASITSLLSGNIGTGTLQAIHITGDNVIFDEAVITDAAIVSLTADKITSGTIYTSRVTIQTAEGDASSLFTGSLLQFSDENYVRLQVGKDANGAFNYYACDENGNIIWDALGLTEAGLTGNGAIIKDAAIADDANINESKIDMQSVAERLNEDGSITVDYANIIVNDTTLDYALASVNSNAEAAAAEAAAANAAAAEAQATANQAQADATQAATDAAEAQSTADAAVTAAAEAQTTADTAKANAATAQAAANTAKSAADEAQTAADDAAAAAQTAQDEYDVLASRADTTEEELAAAQEKLTAAQSAASTAQSTADTAKANAATAQAAAEQAATDAANAQSTADTAKANAVTAQTTANNAASAAADAQSAADDAQAAADAAQSAADAVATRTTTLETELEVVQGQISAIVSETGIENLEDGTSIYDLYSKINATVDDITSEVSGIKTFIGDDYSTTQTLSAVINQQVTDSAANILLEVSDNYITTAEAETTYAKSASLALTVDTDENGTAYGKISTNADYIYFSGRQLVIDTDNLTLDADGNAAFSGTLNAATGSFRGSISIGDAQTYGTKTISPFQVDSDGTTYAMSLYINDEIYMYDPNSRQGWFKTFYIYEGTSTLAIDTLTFTDGFTSDDYSSVSGMLVVTQTSPWSYGLTVTGTALISGATTISGAVTCSSSVTLSAGNTTESILFSTPNIVLRTSGDASSGWNVSFYDNTNSAFLLQVTTSRIMVNKYIDCKSDLYVSGLTALEDTLETYKTTYLATGGSYAVYSQSHMLVRPSSTLSTSNTGRAFQVQVNASNTWADRDDTSNVLISCGFTSTTAFVAIPTTYNLTTSSDANVRVASSGVLYRYSSSASRYKNTINYFDNTDYASPEGLAKRDYTVEESDYRDDYRVILKFPVVQFHYNTGYMTGEPDYDYTKYVTGFIAEDIAALCPACATYTEDGRIEAWNHMEMIPRMVACIQDIYTNVTLIDDRVTILEAQLAEAQLEIVTLKKQLQASAA